jgi:hypothetical protein
MLLDGQSYSYGTAIPVADLDTLTFRPAKDFTGPIAFGGRGSSNGSTWTSQQIQISGRIVEGTGVPGLADLIRLLQILSGMALFPPDSTIVTDINANGKIGIPEVIYILQVISNLRN